MSEREIEVIKARPVDPYLEVLQKDPEGVSARIQEVIQGKGATVEEVKAQLKTEIPASQVENFFRGLQPVTGVIFQGLCEVLDEHPTEFLPDEAVRDLFLERGEEMRKIVEHSTIRPVPFPDTPELFQLLREFLQVADAVKEVKRRESVSDSS